MAPSRNGLAAWEAGEQGVLGGRGGGTGEGADGAEGGSKPERAGIYINVCVIINITPPCIRRTSRDISSLGR